jgi:hypothetical protein
VQAFRVVLLSGAVNRGGPHLFRLRFSRLGWDEAMFSFCSSLSSALFLGPQALESTTTFR